METYLGQKWLVEERDACGVGFIANQSGKADHRIIAKALPALTCLEHRGGCSADQDSGDGAGIMTQIPWKLLLQSPVTTPDGQKVSLSTLIPNDISAIQNRYGVGMIFLPQTDEKVNLAKQIIASGLEAEKLQLVAWRSLPIRPDVLGPLARQTQPTMEQMVVTGDNLSGDDLERRLFLARRSIGTALEKQGLVWGEDVYICSFSCRTIIYKGMVRSAVLAEFYPDLTNPDYESNFAVYHRRFSTNTMPRWPLAQPMR
ncbi:MAG: glutamate synthase subunit alpha, partial [Microcoleaceae cyanobacterium]